ncbi:hypothetical protein [Demequina maris]|uniref:hypothetical protein n=1 Tax=Demequina maris TaxID=1638982 RepID=UPI00078436CD|nr:hypothetical protein [Demequina maris]
MIFTVEARPLPGGQWLLSVLEVPSVTLVVDDIEASAQRVRAEIGGTLVLDVDDDEMRFVALLAARVFWEYPGTWAAYVPNVKRLQVRTEHYWYLPALLDDTAHNLLGWSEDVRVEVSTDINAPIWAVEQPIGGRWVGGVYGTDLIVEADSEDQALRAAIAQVMEQDPDSVVTGFLRDMTMPDDSPEHYAWLKDVVDNYDPDAPTFTTEEIMERIDSLSERRRLASERKSEMVDGMLELNDALQDEPGDDAATDQ